MAQAGITTYSPKISGARGNFNLPARFDMTDGFLGITQDQEGQTDRILLSPKQIKELKAFLAEHNA